MAIQSQVPAHDQIKATARGLVKAVLVAAAFWGILALAWFGGTISKPSPSPSLLGDIGCVEVHLLLDGVDR
jgi:hypothetical protein